MDRRRFEIVYLHLPKIGMYYMVCILLLSCRLETHASTTDTTGNLITIFADKEEGIVSPLIMGFNTVYPNEPDSIWLSGNGKVPQLLKELRTGILRYPGGTVVTHFHWEKPTGQGWADEWDAGFNPKKNQPASSFMDLNEYLDVTVKLKTEPLLGINMGSGIKYNRVQEGIEEAKRMMLHCKKRGIKVKYYYLDNEPYHETANFTFTAEQYADLVNRYVTEMKKVDPDIKTIVNTHPRNLAYTSTLISKAGRNIDYIDIHYYWRWGTATFANWKAEKIMRQGGGLPLRDQRAFYRKLSDSLGFPHIDLISLEWNLGKINNGNLEPTESEVALMVSEAFTQFIQSGMQIATFWPVSWPKHSDFDNRNLLNAQQGYRPNKVYDMFRLYKNILGQRLVKNDASTEAMRVLSVKSTNNDTIWVYLVNKHPVEKVSQVNLHLDEFSPKHVEAVGFNAVDNGSKLKLEPVSISSTGQGKFTLSLPQYSFSRVTFIRK